MLRKLSLRNFKAFRKADISLSDFTVFVGANGSGKSTVLEAADAIATFLAPPPKIAKRFDRRMARLLKFLARKANGSSQGEFVRIEAWWRLGVEADLRATAMVSPSKREHGEGALTVGTGDELHWTGKTDASGAVVTPSRATVRQNDVLRQQSTDLGRPFLMRLDPTQIAADCEVTGTPVLAPDGAGLADVLADLKSSDEEAFRRIETALRAVVGGEPTIRLKRVSIKLDDEIDPDREVPGHRLVLDVHGARSIPAEDLSDGTLVVLALLTAIERLAGPALLLIDDLDHGLHPSAQLSLVEQLRRLQQHRADRGQPLQIVATTHSPYVVAAFEPEDVRLLAAGPSGTRCRRLDEHPEYSDYKDILNPGEFWSSFGEEWVQDDERPANTAGASGEDTA